MKGIEHVIKQVYKQNDMVKICLIKWKRYLTEFEEELPLEDFIMMILCYNKGGRDEKFPEYQQSYKRNILINFQLFIFNINNDKWSQQRIKNVFCKKLWM